VTVDEIQTYQFISFEQSSLISWMDFSSIHYFGTAHYKLLGYQKEFKKKVNRHFYLVRLHLNACRPGFLLVTKYKHFRFQQGKAWRYRNWWSDNGFMLFIFFRYRRCEKFLSQSTVWETNETNVFISGFLGQE
jgi:hypothetical protein